MPRLVLALSLVSLIGCGRARLVDDPLPDASGTPDAGAADTSRFDVARFDVPRVDADTRDAGRDTGTPTTMFEDALTCGIDTQGAIRTALRTSECAGIPFSQTYEAYEAFLFARSAFHLSGLPEGNCEYWRCVEAASNCEDFNACASASACPPDFEPPSCEGEVAVSCGSHPVSHAIDCASFGATCRDGTCVFEEEGCSAPFTRDNDLRCRDGQLRVCGQSLDCVARSDFGCNRVNVQGEVPVAWCGQAGAGLYGAPNDCLSETRLSYVSASGAVVEFECPDFGYRFCGPEGCMSL